MSVSSSGLRERTLPHQTRAEVTRRSAAAAAPAPARPTAATLYPFHYAFLCLLCMTVGLGSIYSLFLSTTLETTFRTRLPASALGAFGTGAVPALPYFADKRNIFNQYFVKKAWGWTSAVVLVHTAASSRRSGPVRPIVRWAIATGAWILFTRWAFGPSINHRFLVMTGGQCTTRSALPGAPSLTNETLTLHPSLCLPGTSAASTSTTRPYWTGGHDISGHTFILVHAIMLIITTVSPTFGRSARPTAAQLGAAALGLALCGLWWWMLLMTSVWFHSPPEKVSGLAAGLMGWASYWAITG